MLWRYLTLRPDGTTSLRGMTTQSTSIPAPNRSVRYEYYWDQMGLPHQEGWLLNQPLPHHQADQKGKNSIETRWDYLTKRDDYSIHHYLSPKQIIIGTKWDCLTKRDDYLTNHYRSPKRSVRKDYFWDHMGLPHQERWVLKGTVSWDWGKLLTVNIDKTYFLMLPEMVCF